MTEAMQKQITQLRLKGLGYKTIATVIGTSKENVRYFCKTHGLMGQASLAELNFEEHKKNPDFCKQCGGKLERNSHSGVKLFCSDKCRREWWKAHPNESKHTKMATYELQCSYCKKVFHSYGKANRKYCCHDCYIKDRFWTDPEIEADEKEVSQRQNVSGKKPVTASIKRIS